MRTKACIHTLTGHTSTVAVVKSQAVEPQVSNLKTWSISIYWCIGYLFKSSFFAGKIQLVSLNLWHLFLRLLYFLRVVKVFEKSACSENLILKKYPQL